MKKLILAFVLMLTFVSCNYEDSNKSVRSSFVASSEYTGNCIELSYMDNDGGFVSLKYNKCKVGEHDCWIRVWPTKYGYGSDLKHIEYLCNYCKH